MMPALLQASALIRSAGFGAPELSFVCAWNCAATLHAMCGIAQTAHMRAKSAITRGLHGSVARVADYINKAYG
jgi:hypothetical protein